MVTRFALPQILFLVSLCCGAAPLVHAGALEQAWVNRIVNDVRVLNVQGGQSRPAQLQDLIKDDLAVTTGAASRAELLFQDKTLTRLGADAIFSFKSGTREISLGRGTMLLQVPKGLGGARIRAAAVTAAITGTTIMIENTPGAQLRVMVLEGSLELSLTERGGAPVVLTPGRMVIMGANDKRIPAPVKVDLARIVKTSALINPALFRGETKTAVEPLPSIGLIENEIAAQRGDVASAASAAELIPPADDASTDETGAATGAPSVAALVELGSGNASSTTASDNDAGATSGGAADGNTGGKPSGGDTGEGNVPGGAANPPRNAYVIDSGTTISTAGAPRINARSGTIYRGFAVDGSAAAFLFGAGTDADARLNFDARFGIDANGNEAPDGVAVFSFGRIILAGTPAVTTGSGPKDIALIAARSVRAGGSPATWDLTGLRSVFVATKAGGITLGKNMDFTAAPGSGFETLHLYARGGNVNLAGSYTLPDGRLVIDSTNHVNLGASGVVNVGEFVINGIEGVHLAGAATAQAAQISTDQRLLITGSIDAATLQTNSGSISFEGAGQATGQHLSFQTSGNFEAGASGSLIRAADTLKIKAGGTVHFSTTGAAGTLFDLTTTKTLQVQGNRLVVGSHVNLSPGTAGTFQAGTQGIAANGHDLTGFQLIEANGGHVAARNLDADSVRTTTGHVKATGNFSASNASIGGHLKVDGFITARPGAAFNSVHVLSAEKFAIKGGLNFKGADAGPLLTAPGNGGTLTLISTKHDLRFDSGDDSIALANFDGGSAASLFDSTAGGDGGTLSIGTAATPTAGKVVLNKPISATTGANGALQSFGGKGGTVSVVANDTVSVDSTVKVSASSGNARSKQGGNIRLESRKRSGTAISISNSGQLLSLLDAAAPGPGGKVEFVSAGGDIQVSGGTIQADKGTINMVNQGAGNIALTNANLRGDVVKANVLGPKGQLIISGGTIDANSAIKLYASGSNGSVIFKQNTTLNGNSVKTIAGNTVTISNGKVVTVNGPAPANIFTNNPNYTGSGGNGSTSGTFGGKGGVTAPFSSRPGY